MEKSSVKDIQQRFDGDVERFSSLETGQSSIVDSVLALDILTEAAACVSPHAASLLDVGCGGGNYTLKMLEKLPHLSVTLLDLSRPMLEKASERISAKYNVPIELAQADIRAVGFKDGEFDIIVAGAVLHHLRTDDEWVSVFSKFYRILKPGGAVWISDLIHHSIPEIQSLMWKRYGDYLTKVKDEKYKEHVFGYIEKEDTPRPVLYQIDLLKRAGFSHIEILHKNSCFATFGALK